ncbi:hypothetical protein WR25_13653 [Diploscapter pachys]|uniref:Transmembrane protein 242 n=1 Tax=Diploscapter pachys TaxID=2018661 RepID=A0A2A2KRU2_9BILA|nr:hypothetical protein WR25_13653 [Diploscapter pachys]
MIGGVGFEAKQQDSQQPVAVVTVEQANKEQQPFKTSTAVKSVLGAASLASLLAGIRAAYKHTRQPEVADLAKAQLVSGAGFAFKALAVATAITVSGFSLIVVGVSALLNVNTPKQFSARMHDTFGGL